MKTHNKYLLLLSVLLSLYLGVSVAGNGIAVSVKGNGVSNQLALTLNDSLVVNLNLNPGTSVNVDADWWVLARTPDGKYHSWIYPTGWVSIGGDLSNPRVTYQGPLFSLNALELINSSARAIAGGEYIIYFGVDTIRNGRIDLDALTYSSFKFTVPFAYDPCPAPKTMVNGVCTTPSIVYPSGWWSGLTARNTVFSFVVDGIAQTVNHFEFMYPDIGLNVGCMGGRSGQAIVDVTVPIIKNQFAYTGTTQCPMYAISSTVFPDGSAYGLIQFTYDQNLCECGGSVTYSWSARKQ